MRVTEEKRCEDLKFYLCLLLALGAALLLAGALHTRTLPFAEGWYTYFARCIHDGELPYRDFEYLYPPVYIYTVALITRLFGYDLIILRRLGILFFLLITLGLYLVALEVLGKKHPVTAAIGAVCGAFYLQSEVVQTFYDYVRFMDIFSVFSLLFLIKACKGLVENRPCRKSLALCGLLLGVLINIKQNIGLIFAAFALVLLLYLNLWAKRPLKVAIFDTLCLLLPLSAFCLAVLGALAATGSLTGYLAMTGVAAAGAKGGLFAILFGWLYHNAGAFLAALPAALLLDGLILGVLWWQKERAVTPEKEPSLLLGTLFFAPLFGLLVAALAFPVLGRALVPRYYLSTYTVFLAVMPLFATLGVLGIKDMIQKTKKLTPFLPFFMLSGAYVAISFGCGNSGGLAEGQASFGILFLVLAFSWIASRTAMLFEEKGYAPSCTLVVRGTLVALALTLALHSADKKLVYPYNWWGMDESDYWSCVASTDLSHLRGITLSPTTANVYGEIVAAITDNTAPDDAIFCFPQIPIFYVLADRPDPGTFTKVQWFDVASDEAVLADIERLRQAPPAAILVYHTSEYAYNAHEAAFRGGRMSGTRQMRDFLLSFTGDNGYRLYDTWQTENNTLTLWLAP